MKNGFNNRKGNNPGRQVALIPVLRDKKCAWSIPRVNEGSLLKNEGEALRRLKQRFRGTTPAGRELYRKMLAGTERQLIRGTKIEDAILYARRQLHAFPSLSAQFKRLFILSCRQSQNVNARAITLDGMATVLVPRIRASLAIKDCTGSKPPRGAADAGPPRLPIGPADVNVHMFKSYAARIQGAPASSVGDSCG
jgi:hypothetical protein